MYAGRAWFGMVIIYLVIYSQLWRCQFHTYDMFYIYYEHVMSCVVLSAYLNYLAFLIIEIFYKGNNSPSSKDWQSEISTCLCSTLYYYVSDDSPFQLHDCAPTKNKEIFASPALGRMLWYTIYRAHVSETFFYSCLHDRYSKNFDHMFISWIKKCVMHKCRYKSRYLPTVPQLVPCANET